MFQKIIALILFILFIPIHILTSIAIIFFDGWPIFYKQKRVGLKNNTFKMYKYRTMLNGVVIFQNLALLTQKK